MTASGRLADVRSSEVYGHRWDNCDLCSPESVKDQPASVSRARFIELELVLCLAVLWEFAILLWASTGLLGTTRKDHVTGGKG